MNKVRKKIKYLLREIEQREKPSSPKPKNDFCIINVVFDTDTFYERCTSIGDFMKKLRNGKLTLNNNSYSDRPKLNNREYFNQLIEEGGFIRYIHSVAFIEINIYLDVIEGLNYPTEIEIIKSRVSKIVPFMECSVGFNDRPLLDKTFRDLSILDTGWSVFGNKYRGLTLQ